MKTLNVAQKSPEWLAIRLECDTASEAAAASGQHKYITRTELLKNKKGGPAVVVDTAKQALFDRGHQSEDAARPFGEKIIGQDLYPVTGTLEIAGLKLLASFDGMTMDEQVIFEHKLWSEPLANDVRNGTLAPHYTIQMDQQLLVSGAQKCLFMVSDGTESNMVWCWYEANQQKFDALILAWKQFRLDLAEFEFATIEEKPLAKAAIELPALVLQAEGRLVNSNMMAFGIALKEHLAETRALVYTTDQEFADAEARAKLYRDTGKKLELAKESMLAQTASIDEAFRLIDSWREDLRVTALQIEKDCKANKESRQITIINEGKIAFTAFIAELEAGIAPIRLLYTMPNFAEAIKGKRLFTAMHDAIQNALANGKIEHSKVAAGIAANLNWLKQHDEHRALLADLQTIVYKPADDFQLLVTTRIENRKRAEEAKIEAAKQEAAAQAVAEERARAEAARVIEEQKTKAAEQERLQADAIAAAEVLAKARAEQIEAAKTTEATIIGIDPARPGSDHNVEAVVRVSDSGAHELVGIKTTPSTPPSLRLGQIGERLGFNLTADFLRTLGFEATRDKNAVLFHEHQFNEICAALIKHISVAMQSKAA